MYLFGSGTLYGIPTSDANGNAIAVPTPVKFGTLQNVSVDVSFENKTLYGQSQFPVAVGRGKGKISGKASFASLNGATVNSMFFGQTLSSGIIGVVNDVTGTAVPTTPFQITPTVPNAGTWTLDLGVTDANGRDFTRVTSGPTTGQYSVSAGVYTFATADTALVVFISYEYTATSTTAKKSTVSNLLMGYAPTFRCELSAPYAGKQMTLTLFNCISSKMTFATKQDDFMVPEFDFDAFANSAGQVMTYQFSE
jgi:hypothetical protein